jgi:hypothetical protein
VLGTARQPETLTYTLYLEFYKMTSTSVGQVRFVSAVIGIPTNLRALEIVEFGAVANGIDEIVPGGKFVDLLRTFISDERRDEPSMERSFETAAEAWPHLRLLLRDKPDFDSAVLVRLLGHAVGVIENAHRIFTHFFRTPEAFTGLSALLLSDNDSVVVAVFSLIAEAHRHSIDPGFSLTTHIGILFDQMKGPPFSASLVERLSGLVTDGNPELFAAVSYFAIACGRPAFLRLFETVTPSERFCQPSHGAVFGAIVFDAPFVFSFVAKCSPLQWCVLFSLIRCSGL